MTRDIDNVLRRMAEQDRPTSEDQARVWTHVQQLMDQPRPRRRTRRWAVAVAAAVALLSIGVMVQRDVGTEDFTLRPAPHADPGVQAFESARGYYGFQIENSGLDDQEANALAEEIRAKFEAGERRLTRVYGHTIAGKTTLTGSFEIQTHNGPRGFSADLDSPSSDRLTSAELALRAQFLTAHASDCVLAVKEGRAEQLGSQSVTALGVQVLCRRWAIGFPDYGTVIYWMSEPLP